MSQQSQGDPMRILHVIHSLRRGGAEQSLVTLSRHLSSRGHEIHVLALWPPYDLQEELTEAGVRVHQGDVGTRWNLPATTSRVVKLSDRIQPHVLHAHLRHAELAVGFAPLGGYDAVRLATFHNLPPISPAGIAGRLGRAARRFLHTRRFQGALGVSEAVADRHRRLLNTETIEVVPNPVELPRDEGKESVEGNPSDGFVSDDGAFTILSPGRTSPEKGHDVLIEALPYLQGSGHDVRAILVGGGPGVSRLERQARQLDVGEILEIHESIPHDHLLAAMRAADLVAIPSRSEGFGLAAAEAMAVGSPLVATSVGGLREVVDHGKTGLLVPPEDPKALAQAIAELADDPSLRATIANEARRQVRKRYAPGRIADRTEDVYRSFTSTSDERCGR